VNRLGSRRDDFGFIVQAWAFFIGVAREVGVVLILHDTIIDNELPGRWQETALTAIHTIVLTEASLIGRVGGQGTVDKTLLRETHWRCLSLLGNCAFEGGDSGKGPTRTASALIFNRENPAISVVIDSGCTINITCILELATFASFSAVIMSVIDERVVLFWASATEKCHVLLRLHVGGKIVTEDKSVGVSIMCMLAIVIGDRRVVNMVTALPSLESARVRHVLVVLRAI